MVDIYSYDFGECFIKILIKLVRDGEPVTVRGYPTKELLSCHVTVANPYDICYFFPFRRDNIFAKIAETLWVLAGRNDIKWLSYYLPRAYDFSDDGYSWRAAYGYRLRHWKFDDTGETFKEIDQLEYIYSKLYSNPTTRQAVISIWDPSKDNRDSKDIPCNNWLHFIKRRVGNQDFLHLNIAQRSADFFWGWSNINVFEWSILLQMMSFWTDSAPGNMSWLVSSMHMYDRHFETADKIIDSFIPKVPKFHKYPKFSTPFKDLDYMLHKIFSAEALLRISNEIDYRPPRILTGDELLDTFFCMLAIFINFKRGASLDMLADIIADMDDTEYKYAAILHVARERRDILTYDVGDSEMIDYITHVLDVEG